MQSQVVPQSKVATNPAVESTPAAGSRRRYFLYGFLALQLAIVVIVSLGMFQKLMVGSGEEDARKALRMIGLEMERSLALPSPGVAAVPTTSLATWIDSQKTIQHRLADARVIDGALTYHGYRLEWRPRKAAPAIGEKDSTLGTLWAIPLRPGVTGEATYQRRVGPSPSPATTATH